MITRAQAVSLFNDILTNVLQFATDAHVRDSLTDMNVTDIVDVVGLSEEKIDAMVTTATDAQNVVTVTPVPFRERKLLKTLVQWHRWSASQQVTRFADWNSLNAESFELFRQTIAPSLALAARGMGSVTAPATSENLVSKFESNR